MCSGGVWGSVCDDYFGWVDAKVACVSLGYSGSRKYCGYIDITIIVVFVIVVLGYSCCARYYGQGYGSIFLDNLHCSGNEASLFSCPHNGVGNHNCQHSEDSGIHCIGKSYNELFSINNY